MATRARASSTSSWDLLTSAASTAAVAASRAAMVSSAVTSLARLVISSSVAPRSLAASTRARAASTSPLCSRVRSPGAGRASMAAMAAAMALSKSSSTGNRSMRPTIFLNISMASATLIELLPSTSAAYHASPSRASNPAVCLRTRTASVTLTVPFLLTSPYRKLLPPRAGVASIIPSKQIKKKIPRCFVNLEKNMVTGTSKNYL